MMKEPIFVFRLFVAGDTPNSAQALKNLSALCRTRLADQHEIEVVDVFRHPQQALANGIFMTPTLLRLAPGPALRMVGTLKDEATLLLALGFEAAST